MSINIIKHGIGFFKAECKKCGCIFSFDEEDLQTSFRLGPYSPTEEIDCPDCGNHLIWRYGEKSGRDKEKLLEKIKNKYSFYY